MIHFLSLSIGMLFFGSLKLLAQENRSYQLKVDFGEADLVQDYWYSWQEAQTCSTSRRLIANVFDNSGLQIELSTNCQDQDSTCGIISQENPYVYDTYIDEVVSDGIKIRNDHLNLKLYGLPNGHFDIKLYFHDSATSNRNDKVSVKLTDARATNGIWLSSSIKYSTGEFPNRLSSFRVPIEVKNGRAVALRLESSQSSFLLNGFELTQYRERHVLSNGVELIGQHRIGEALISGISDNSSNVFSCSSNIDGLETIGYWNSTNNSCDLVVNETPISDQNFKFLKFDPFFYWQFTQNSSIPSNGIAFNSPSGSVYYACSAPASSNQTLPGMVSESTSGSCQVIENGDVAYYDDFYVYSRKSLP